MSAERNGEKWTHEETLAVFALYMMMDNRDVWKTEEPCVVEFANAVKREPGAVCIKLQNVLSKDPNATRKGLDNAAEIIERMWRDFKERGDEFVGEAAAAYRLVMSGELFGGPQLSIEFEKRAGRDLRTTSTRRLNQEYFRKSLLHLYGYRCCVTGLKVGPLMVASHIKPWSDSDPHTERVNVENGLPLNALHDRAFDKGLISVSDDFEILISRELRRRCEEDATGALRWICDPKRRRLHPPETHRPNPEFLAYHRDVIFKG